MQRFPQEEIERAAREIEGKMSPAAKEELAALAPEDLVLTHFGLGQWIRNALVERGTAYREVLDDFSEAVILFIYHRLNEKE